MKLSIDRIDEGIAVLIVQDGTGRQVRLPATLLPPGSREGDILEMTLEPDPAGTSAARDRVTGLIGKLRKNA